MIRLNAKLLVGLLIAGVLLGTGTYAVHRLQVKRKAQSYLRLAEQSEQRGDAAKTEAYLKQYLGYVPGDLAAQVKYGLLIEKRARSVQDYRQALVIFERVLRFRPERKDLRRKLVDLQMKPELGESEDPRPHLEILLSASPEDGELEFLLARAEEGRGNIERARELYEKAIDHAPGQVDAYVRYAGLLRDRFDEAPKADKLLETMVSKNGRSFRAYLARSAHLKDRDRVEEDLKKARELAPDEPDALLASAEFETTRTPPDTARARGYLEQGVKLRPRDARMYQALAGVELLPPAHPREAAEWLRQGIAALARATDPDEVGARARLNWSLAELLIQDDKLKEAQEVLALLRKNGDVAEELLDYQAASVLARQEKWSEAAQMLEKVVPYLTAAPERATLAKQAHLLLGQCYERLEEPGKQYTSYRRAVALDPTNAMARLGVASALESLGKTDEAIDEYRTILKGQPGIAIVLARLLVRRELQSHSKQRDWDEAEQVLNQAETATPDLIDVPILRAEVLAAQGKLDQARARLQKACEAHPDRSEPWTALAVLAGRQGKPEETLTVLDEAKRRLGDRVELRLARARYWADHGPDAAKPLADLAEDIAEFSDPDRHRLLQGLAEAHLRAGDSKEAERLLKQVAGQWRDDLTSRILLFDLVLRQDRPKDIDAAVQEIRRVEDKRGVLWRYARACQLIRGAKPGDDKALAEAREHLTAVAARRPGWSRVALAQAQIEDKEGDREQAAEQFKRAIVDLGDRSPEAILYVLQYLHQQQRDPEALAILESLRDQDLASKTVQLLAAEILLRAGRGEADARRALELTRKAVPEDSETYREQILLGQALGAAGERAKAEAALRRAVSLAPDKPDAREALVFFLIAVGQKANAEAAIHEAEAALPAGQGTLELARCYERLGQQDRAKALFEETARTAKADDVNVQKQIAGYYLRNGRLSDAETLLRELIELENAAPDDQAWANRLLSLIVAAGGDYQKSKALLASLGLKDENQPIAPKPDEPIEELRTKVKVLAMQRSRGLKQNAIRLLESVIQREPARTDDLYLLAQLYDAVGNWPKAREQMRALMATDEKAPLYLNYLADYTGRLLRHDEVAEASTLLTKLEERAPANLRTVELKARLAKARGKDAEAVALLTGHARAHAADAARVATVLESLGQVAAAEPLYRKVATESQTPQATISLAGFLARQDRTKEALDLCEQAGHAQSLPAESVAEAGLAILYESSTDHPEQVRRVETWIETLRRQSPKSTRVLFNLANLRSMQGRYRDAATLYRQCIGLDDKNSGPMNNLAWLLAVDEHKGREALDLISRAIALAGPGPELLDTRATAYMAAGRTSEAIKDLEDALVAAPTASMHFHLAQALLQAKNPQAAIEEFQKAKDLKLNLKTLHPAEKADYQLLLDKLAQN